MTDSNEPKPVRESRQAESILEQAGQALFRLGRILSRHPVKDQLQRRTGQVVELSRILVTEAVAAGPAEPGQEVTVGVVAERLGIDPSTASRLVAETIEDGYLARLSSQMDSRRLRLELTDAGRELVANAHRYQGTVLEYVTRDWTDSERQEFARLLIKFVASFAETRAQLFESDGRSME
ncbi:MAG: winged helix-turn-helix transcriptional regulator [Ktedonobacteraceae bacterium]|nr:winged helix-turn-helix transcriptional regulator [Ktedonobacteraceae bacterium]